MNDLRDGRALVAGQPGDLLQGQALAGHAQQPADAGASHVFAVGDLRSGSTKRVATAVGEGAGAVSSVRTVLGG
ncbi:hypothetical protein GCM10009733_109090 [Nonomuraea maheshkhaliensis]|uniref:NAD(P)/FAD-dependent oxidoreductase n=1 Tax=Nonomuraea maheshkhaliensis TaxID=419590 RepID=A0ABN2HZB8_9ACTN